MPRSTYTPAFKTKIVLEVLREEKELGEIAAEHSLNPNMVRNWKREFLENAETVFENPKKLEKKAKRKEAALEKKNNQMLKTIGQRPRTAQDSEPAQKRGLSDWPQAGASADAGDEHPQRARARSTRAAKSRRFAISAATRRLPR